jgi:hypothetical protein
MFLLPTLERPDEYVAKCEHFSQIVDELKLTPMGRHEAWVEFTKDETWKEWPVPIRWFLHDPYYVGPEVEIRETVEDFLADYFNPFGIFEIMVVVAGLGAGKSFSASLAMQYVIYQLSCLRSPQRWLSKFPGISISGDAEIVLMNASAAGANQAGKIVFGDAFEKIMAAPYFKYDFPPYGGGSSELLFDHRIRLSPGTSKPETALGWNMFFFVVDEAGFGIESARMDYVEALFLGFNQRRRSRWSKMGGGGLYTSPGAEQSFIETLAGQGDDWDESIMVFRTTTWEAKGESKPGAHGFLFDRHADVTRIVLEDVTYRGLTDDGKFGIGELPNGEEIRWRVGPAEERDRLATAA